MGNAKYPNKFKTKEKYIASLVGAYSSQYPDLNLNGKQWELPITKAVNCASGRINDFPNDIQWILHAIDYVKDVTLPDLSREEVSLITSTYNDKTELYYFSIGNEEEVRCLLEEDFPEPQKERYLEFISRMTKDVVNAICSETLKSIPETEKIIYARSLAGGDRSDSPIADESQKEQSFAQRVLDEGDRKPSSESKKRKVSFVDEIIATKKNDGTTTQVH
jgi:hypothetical protein